MFSHCKLDALAKASKPYEGITHRFNISDFQGYAGHLDPSVVSRLRDHSDVHAIESDKLWTTAAMTRQMHSGYGLDYISHRSTKGRSKSVYLYDDTAGADTFAYIIDSGINIGHFEFEGRASLGYNAVRSVPFDDFLGHGTHVAGVVGSRLYGVAKCCNLIAVKVTHTETSSMSSIMDGYQWAARDIVQRRRQDKAVINVSLYGDYSPAFNRLVDAAFASGISTVVCAGNLGVEAAGTSPASARGAITVGATDSRQERAHFSKWGPTVSIFAPGVDILSTWVGSRAVTSEDYGTSVASACVAGLVLYFKRCFSLPDAKSTRQFVLGIATPEVVRSSKGSKNLFAYNGSKR
ncbi:hypothetical protein ANO11243_002540 [Dothideomycetidae sp. 11243]|nr:hypothetical protein ANO11243_002540 [fungal sp. No.11243]